MAYTWSLVKILDESGAHSELITVIVLALILDYEQKHEKRRSLLRLGSSEAAGSCDFGAKLEVCRITNVGHYILPLVQSLR